LYVFDQKRRRARSKQALCHAQMLIPYQRVEARVVTKGQDRRDGL
jgi:hypothetical protein